MAPPKTTVWNHDPHTEAKHAILSRYLQAWFPIIAKGFPDRGLTYVDAFAGPGEYDDGSDGSPLIALQQAHRREVRQYRAPQRLLFIEDDAKRAKHLEALVNRRFPEERRYPDITVRIVAGKCGDLIIPALADIRGDSSPIFVNFDGWGADTPFSLVRYIGRIQSAEVLVTFNTQHFIRFAVLDNVASGDRVFGDRYWRDLVLGAKTPQQKKELLVTRYRVILGEAGFPHALTFELADEGGNAFLLVYGTRSELGIEKMKDAMWSVDSIAGSRFRDPRDLNQEMFDLDEGPALPVLERQLIDRLESLPAHSASLADLKRYALSDTIFKAAHATRAARNLEGNGKIQVEWHRRHEDTTVVLAQPTLF